MQGYVKEELDFNQTAHLLSRKTMDELSEMDKKIEHSEDSCHGYKEETEHSDDGRITNKEQIEGSMFHHVKKEAEAVTQEKKTSEQSLKAAESNSGANGWFWENKENLMKFAEILYKCTLCTTMPSILTSEKSFLSHVSEQHLNKQNSAIPCRHCELRFDTEEDLKSHKEISHSENSISSHEDFPFPDLNRLKMEELSMQNRFSPHQEPTSWTSTPTPTHNITPNPAPSQGLARGPRKQNYVPPWSSYQEEDPKKSNDIECSPKVNIVHEAKSPCRNYVSPPLEENRARIQELTSEIFAKNCDIRNVQQNSEIRSTIGNISMLNVSHTPEFGNYTKLVREGGSIVYFCQVCNWKSQVKLHFAGHCKNKLHVEKVKAAEDKCNVDQEGIEKRKKELPLSLVVKSESIKLGLNDTGRDFDNDTNGKAGNSATKRVSPHRPNKRKRTSQSMIRYYDNKGDWNSTDSDSSNSSYFLPSRVSSSQETEVTKCTQFSPKLPLPSPRKDNCNRSNVIDPEISGAPRMGTALPLASNCNFVKQGGSEKALSDQRKNLHAGNPSLNSAVFPELKTISASANLTDSKVESTNENSSCSKMTKDDLEHKPVAIYPALLNQLLSVKPYSNSTTLNQELHSPRMHEGKPCSMYYCNSCRVDCETDSKMKRHMGKMKHKIAAMENRGRGLEEKEEVGEVGKIIKLKEVIPGLIFASQYGNVSRDQLLQRVSEITGIPEATQWGPACNKAMRELYPDSNAQRKGKYKNYFFGVSFLEPQQEPEDASDTELSSLQSLRDVSHDLDRILIHIHDVLEWSDDMENGVIREDLLAILSVKLNEPEILHRGMLCNKAMRVAFPMVKMMRKGKFKTVYFGVKFKADVQQLTLDSTANPLSPFPIRKSKKRKAVQESDIRHTVGSDLSMQTGPAQTHRPTESEIPMVSILPGRIDHSYWLKKFAKKTAHELSPSEGIPATSADLKSGNSQSMDEKFDTKSSFPSVIETLEMPKKSRMMETDADEKCDGLGKKKIMNFKELDVSSGENEDDSDDDADDERSASPSLPDADDGPECHQKKSGLIMRFKRNSSSETIKADLSSVNNGKSNFSAEILTKANSDQDKYAI